MRDERIFNSIRSLPLQRSQPFCRWIGYKATPVDFIRAPSSNSQNMYLPVESIISSQTLRECVLCFLIFLFAPFHHPARGSHQPNENDPSASLFSHSFTLVDSSLVGFCCCWLRCCCSFFLRLSARLRRLRVSFSLCEEPCWFKKFFLLFYFQEALTGSSKKERKRKKSINKIRRDCVPGRAVMWTLKK